MQQESEPQKYVLWLTAFFATFSFVSVLPGLPSYLDDRGLFYGFATAAFPAATAVFSFVVPRAQKTQSSRSILIFCFIVAGLCSVCFGLIRNKWAILVMRFIMGATTSCVVVVRDDLNKLCGKDKNKRIKVMSLFTFSMGMGYAVGALIGSGLQKLSPSVAVQDHFAIDGNTYSGFVLCGLEAILIVLTLIFVPHTPPAFSPQAMSGVQVDGGTSASTPLLPPTSDGSLPPANPSPASPPPPQDVFTMQHIMVYLSTCFVTISFVAYVTLAVPYIAKLENLSESTAGLIEAAIGGAYGIAAICNPTLIQHMRSSAATLTLGGLTAAGANALMLQDPGLPRVIVGCCFIGLAYSIINSVGMYHLGDLSKGDRFAQLRSFAVVSSLASVGRVLAPVMAGVLLYFHKEQAVYITSLLFGVLSSSYCLFVWIRSGCLRTDHPETQGAIPPPPSGTSQRLT